jgi:SMODS-associating 2TM, beta-strand rich effector domain
MRIVRIEPKKIATVSAILFLSLYTGLLAARGEDLSALLAAAAKSGGIIAVIGLFWLWYCKSGWRVPIPLFQRWLYEGPDLNGRWEGTIHRLNESTPHDFVLEITQSALGLSYRTFSARSVGESLTCTLLASNEEGTTFQLISTWQSNSVRLDNSNVRDFFRGTSVWLISIGDGDRSEMQMHDTYFTEREPTTKGVGNIAWISPKLKNRFK